MRLPADYLSAPATGCWQDGSGVRLRAGAVTRPVYGSSVELLALRLVRG